MILVQKPTAQLNFPIISPWLHIQEFFTVMLSNNRGPSEHKRLRAGNLMVISEVQSTSMDSESNKGGGGDGDDDDEMTVLSSDEEDHDFVQEKISSSSNASTSSSVPSTEAWIGDVAERSGIHVSPGKQKANEEDAEVKIESPSDGKDVASEQDRRQEPAGGLGVWSFARKLGQWRSKAKNSGGLGGEIDEEQPDQGPYTSENSNFDFAMEADVEGTLQKSGKELDQTQEFASTSSPLPPNDIKVGAGDLATTAAMDNINSPKSSQDDRIAEVAALRRQLDDTLVRLSDSQAEVTTTKEVSK